MFVKKLKDCLMGIATPVLLIWAGAANAEWGLNMTPGVTPISREVYDLHMLILWIVTVIGIGVFGVMFWSIFHHRKSKGAVPAKFHHSAFAEITWTIIPILILVSMAVPATRTLIKMEQTGDAEITVKITGYQWKWKYDYLNEDLSFFSVLDQASNEARQRGSNIDPQTVEHYLLNVDQPVVLPVNKKIRLLTTANDVIHAWWVPALGWKRDAIPGFINDNWAIIEKEGTYRGQCAELCGKDHAFMPIVLKAVPEEEYNAWVEEMKLVQAEATAGADREWSKDELMAKGKEVYGATCSACHMANGQGLPGTFPPLVDGKEFAASAAMTKPLEERGFWKDGKIVLGPSAKHIDIVLHGIAGTAMAAFGPQLNDVDIAAVVTFERNAFGNSTGDVVQPKDIKAAR